MRSLPRIIPKTLTSRTLLAFAVFTLILTMLGSAFFIYQRSLFDPRQFNQQLLERGLLAVNQLDRRPAAQDNRFNQILGTTSLVVLPANLRVDLNDDLEQVEDLSPQQRDFVRNLRRRIREMNTIYRWPKGNRLAKKSVNIYRALDIRVVEISDKLIDTLEEKQKKAERRMLNRAEAQDGRFWRFRPRDLRNNRRSLSRALRRPLVLLTFKTSKGVERQLLLMPAFTNVRFAGLLIGLFFAILLLAGALTAYAVGTITTPLARLTNSARRFGQSLQPEPVETKGHGEVGEALTAFNSMQQQVRGLVDERTRIIGAVSHDLRTHLTRIRLRMQMLEDGNPDNEKLTKHTGKTISDLEQMEAILVSSLEYTRHSTGEKRQLTEEINLNQFLADLTGAYLPPIPFIDSTSDGSRINMATDKTALARALNNILTNAERHGENPKLELQQIRATKGQQTAVILIVDEGPGIPKTERNKVLEPFYRIEKSRNRETGGTGLGLSIAYEIIIGMGGNLTLSDRCDGSPGLSVRIELPI